MGASRKRKDGEEMKAAIYNPYLDTLGGGERYMMGIVNALEKNDFSVDIQWEDENILNKLQDRFNVKTNNTQVVRDVKRGDGYDLIFWVSDGSIPLLRSRNNILHFQVPFMKVNGKNIMNRMKLARIKHVVCNSEFTKSFIDKEFGIDSKVLYPPVSVSKFKAKRQKENIILYVGRFSKLMQSKRQDVLINNFKKLYDDNMKGWKLILLGGAEVGGEESVNYLKKEAEGYPINIIESPSFKVLQDYYSKAKIFWSASGYEVDEKSEPNKVEHFGITVVEAMAAGAVPIVYNAGGHKEIIENKESGYLWSKGKELREITRMLIENKKELSKVSRNSVNKSKEFGEENFIKSFSQLIS